MEQFIKFRINPVSDYIINNDNIHQNNVQDNDFINIRTRLNMAKSLLDEIPEKDYSCISQKLDAFKPMKHTLAYKYRIQTVTNATLKIYELVTQMNLIKSNKISVFCNAELPGNFIIGINHYMQTMHKNAVFRWVASSYLSEKGTLGDHYGILEYNKNNWLMDKQMNGDITDKDNIIELSNRVLKRFPKGVDLYTSDAGFDVSNNYNEQEEQTLILNYGQVLSGLLTLTIGGSLVTKQFTYFTPFNKSLITLLSNLFDELYVTKPVTSRPLNSEIYIVGINFKGISDTLKEYLINKMPYIDPDIPLILYDLTDDLLISVDYIYSQQIKYILQVYDTYASGDNTSKLIDHKSIQEKWLNDNPIYPIDKLKYIPYNR